MVKTTQTLWYRLHVPGYARGSYDAPGLFRVYRELSVTLSLLTVSYFEILRKEDISRVR